MQLVQTGSRRTSHDLSRHPYPISLGSIFLLAEVNRKANDQSFASQKVGQKRHGGPDEVR